MRRRKGMKSIFMLSFCPFLKGEIAEDIFAVIPLSYWDLTGQGVFLSGGYCMETASTGHSLAQNPHAMQAFSCFRKGYP